MLILKQNVPGSVPTPAAGKGTIFLNDSDVLSVKDSGGTVTSFPTVGGANTQVIFNDDFYMLMALHMISNSQQVQTLKSYSTMTVISVLTQTLLSTKIQIH